MASISDSKHGDADSWKGRGFDDGMEHPHNIFAVY